jgi:FkbM family methyltransferase
MRSPLRLLSLARAVVFGEPGTVPLRYFRDFLPSAPVIGEAGAHGGGDTVRLARAWPRGHVHAFEPVPPLFQRLSTRVRRRQNVSCYPLAVADGVGSAEIFVSSGASDASSSLLQPTGHVVEHPQVVFNQVLNVPVTTLDQWAHDQGVRTVDFMWLDLQGGELAALRGAATLLASVRVVYSEVSLKPMYQGGPLYPEFREWMAAKGFAVVREKLPYPDMGNVVFVRRE